MYNDVQVVLLCLVLCVKSVRFRRNHAQADTVVGLGNHFRAILLLAPVTHDKYRDLHARQDILDAHETALTKLLYQLSHNVLDMDDIARGLLVLTEHNLGGFLGVEDTLRHNLHDLINLLHVLHKVFV